MTFITSLKRCDHSASKIRRNKILRPHSVFNLTQTNVTVMKKKANLTESKINPHLLFLFIVRSMLSLKNFAEVSDFDKNIFLFFYCVMFVPVST